MSEDSKKAGDDEDKAMKARLEALSTALDAKQQGHAEAAAAEEAGQKTGRAMSLGFRVLSEFVAGIGVGAIMGWYLDIWFGTSPILLIILLMLGTAAGFWNVYRLAAAPTGSQGEGSGHK